MQPMMRADLISDFGTAENAVTALTLWAASLIP